MVFTSYGGKGSARRAEQGRCFLLLGEDCFFGYCAFDHEHVLQVALQRLALKVYLQLNGIEKLDEHFKGFDLKRLKDLILDKL